MLNKRVNEGYLSCLCIKFSSNDLDLIILAVISNKSFIKLTLINELYYFQIDFY